MVAAVEEVVHKRNAKRLLAIFEAAIWVVGGILIGNALGLTMLFPTGYQINVWTFLGGALLGLGAAINRACVFGAIAKFGNGDSAYLLTPVGYWFGAWIGQATTHWGSKPIPLMATSQILKLPALIAVCIGGWMLWRVFVPLWRQNQEASSTGFFTRWKNHIWKPHEATLVIAVTFFLLWAIAGKWTYIDFLRDSVTGSFHQWGLRITLFIALWGGALWGGWSAGRLGSRTFSRRYALQYASGGALMGLGAEWVPGANDGLLLVGIPLMWGYAWIAITTMVVSITIKLITDQRRRVS